MNCISGVRYDQDSMAFEVSNLYDQDSMASPAGEAPGFSSSMTNVKKFFVYNALYLTNICLLVDNLLGLVNFVFWAIGSTYSQI